MLGSTQWVRFLLNFHLNVGITGTKCSTLGAVNVLIFSLFVFCVLKPNHNFSEIFFEYLEKWTDILLR
jgi:hypothetical protein